MKTKTVYRSYIFDCYVTLALKSYELGVPVVIYIQNTLHSCGATENCMLLKIFLQQMKFFETLQIYILNKQSSTELTVVLAENLNIATSAILERIAMELNGDQSASPDYKLKELDDAWTESAAVVKPGPG